MKFLQDNVAKDNKLSCEWKVMIVPGQPLPRGSSLPQVHVNIPRECPKS